MDVLRDILAGSNRKTFTTDSRMGFPVTLSVDVKDLFDSWRVDPHMSPSAELKIRAGVYGKWVKKDWESRLYGRPVSMFKVKTLFYCRSDRLHSSVSNDVRDPQKVGEVSMGCRKDLEKFLLDTFEQGYKAVNVHKALDFSGVGKPMLFKEVLDRLKRSFPNKCGGDWFFFHPTNLVFNDPGNGTAHMYFTSNPVSDILYYLNNESSHLNRDYDDVSDRLADYLLELLSRG